MVGTKGRQRIFMSVFFLFPYIALMSDFLLGWVYGHSFHTIERNSAPEGELGMCVRRRKWVRKRELCHASRWKGAERVNLGQWKGRKGWLHLFKLHRQKRFVDKL